MAVVDAPAAVESPATIADDSAVKVTPYIYYQSLPEQVERKTYKILAQILRSSDGTLLVRPLACSRNAGKSGLNEREAVTQTAFVRGRATSQICRVV